jgi:2,3-dihydroxy-2,3-dihydro-p-cumate dehydrogenase
MADILAGQVAIVTGAGQGIGLAIARRLRADGASVVAADLVEPVAQATVERLGGPSCALGFGGDLADPEVAARLIDASIERFGAIDILVNNAGGGIIRPFLTHSPETLRETVDRNLWTAVWCSYYALPYMRRAVYGRIVSIGADSVRNGLSDHAGYNAAKGGVHALTTGLAREFAGDGITVNCVAPSAVETPQLADVRRSNSDLARRVLEVIPMGRAATEAEVAGMVAYLVGPDAGFVTGQVLSLNGGASML